MTGKFLRTYTDIDVRFMTEQIGTLFGLLVEKPVDVLVCDYEFESDQHADGLNLLARIRRIAPQTRVLLESVCLRPPADAGSAAAKLQPLVGEIGWAHNLLILSRCKNAQEREFYLCMTRKFGWSKNVLAHQIDNQSYEKSLLGQTNFDQTLTPALREQAKLAVKDRYAFDFLELGEQHSERELERALIARIEDFLRAMGGMYAFMGSQYRLEVDGEEFFVDLLLFHRRLRALVAIELKIGKFVPEFVGKMQFYLAALDVQI